MKAVIFAVAFLLCAPVFATMVKCTSKAGKVSYQDDVCPDGAKPEMMVPCCSTAPTKESWRFERVTDRMTGVSTCRVTSPAGIVPVGTHGTANISIQIGMRKDFASLQILTNNQSDIFHHKIDGMGIKVGNYDFMPITQKLNANAVGFLNPVDGATLILKMFPTAKDIQLRLRFWPWEQLQDTYSPIPLQGFKQAFSLAQECAKSI